MCGIAGIVGVEGGNPPETARIEAMCATLRHRGPDDCAVEVREEVGIGMTRLAVIDVDGGRQPVSNEDGTVRVVFNGEIYNFRELRRELVGKGHRFATRSDTEVIVHLWEEFGVDFAKRLNGMFAIALHDMRRKRFVLVRDPIGIKPLFYAWTGSHLVFGSEIKALLASGLVERELDIDALAQFVSWEYVPGARTLLRSIQKLEAGRRMELRLDTGRLRIEPFWEMPVPAGHQDEGGMTDEEWTEAIEAKIRECVQRQLVSDVPVGVFLSGGVDSSIIAASMGRAKSFTIGFRDPTYNELNWARCVADHLNLEHAFEMVEADVTDLFDHLMTFMDDPIGDFSIFPTFLISRYARRGVTVALSGDGGDELFGGYETYLAAMLWRRWKKLPAGVRNGVLEPLIRRLPPTPKKKGWVNKAKRFVEGLEHGEDLGHARWRLFAGEPVREALFTPQARKKMRTPVDAHIRELADRASGSEEIGRSLYIDMRSYLADNCLVKMDRMSMASSLEVRVPFLDTELVELASSMPARLKVRTGETKPLLKRIAARHVPPECVYRPKEGFSIPMKHWLRRELRPLMETLLAPDRLAGEGIFNPGFVSRLKEEHLANRENHSHLLWALMVFEDWRRRWAV